LIREAALLLLVAAAPGAVPQELGAQLLRPRLELSPYAGVLHPGDLDLVELDDAVVFGARVAVRLPPGVAVEGQLGYAPLDAHADPAVGGGDFDVSLWLYEAGLAWALPLPGPLTPTFGLTGGQARMDPDLERGGREVDAQSSFVLSPGVGLRLSLGGINLRADLRDHIVWNALEDVNRALSPEEGDGETLQAVEASLGLSLLF
jgi:hypothetical protein